MPALVGGADIIGLDIVCSLRPKAKGVMSELIGLTGYFGLSLAIAGNSGLQTGQGDDVRGRTGQ